MTERHKSVDGHIRKQESAIEAYIARIREILGKELKAGTKKLKGGNLKAVLGTLADLEAKISDSGLSREITRLREIYANELQFIATDLKGVGISVKFLDVDQDTIGELIKFDMSRVTTTANDYLANAKADIVRTILTGQTPDIDGIDEREGKSVEHVLKTEINTAVQMFNRAVTIKKAKDAGFEKFIYLGPLDDITRPFCAERVDNIYTLDEIEEWDNGTDLDPLTSCGGYNCRHQLRPVRGDD